MSRRSTLENNDSIGAFQDVKSLTYVEKIKDKYKIEKVIGKGSIGEVRKCLHKQSST